MGLIGILGPVIMDPFVPKSPSCADQETETQTRNRLHYWHNIHTPRQPRTYAPRQAHTVREYSHSPSSRPRLSVLVGNTPVPDSQGTDSYDR